MSVSEENSFPFIEEQSMTILKFQFQFQSLVIIIPCKCVEVCVP